MTSKCLCQPSDTGFKSLRGNSESLRSNTYRSGHQQTGHCSEGSGKCSRGQSSKEINMLNKVQFEEHWF